jgi:hypothetical protein
MASGLLDIRSDIVGFLHGDVCFQFAATNTLMAATVRPKIFKYLYHIRAVCYLFCDNEK